MNLRSGITHQLLNTGIVLLGEHLLRCGEHLRKPCAKGVCCALILLHLYCILTCDLCHFHLTRKLLTQRALTQPCAHGIECQSDAAKPADRPAQTNKECRMRPQLIEWRQQDCECEDEHTQPRKRCPYGIKRIVSEQRRGDCAPIV